MFAVKEVRDLMTATDALLTALGGGDLEPLIADKVAPVRDALSHLMLCPSANEHIAECKVD